MKEKGLHSMYRYFKQMFVALALVSLVLAGGCGKEEEKFNFTNVTALKVFPSSGAGSVEILNQSEVEDLVEQIRAITWEEETDDDAETSADAVTTQDAAHYEDWLYRVQCYDKKGEKKQNIYVVSEREIIYKDVFWTTQDEEEALDLAVYDKLFQ
jgi:hypothetical protein